MIFFGERKYSKSRTSCIAFGLRLRVAEAEGKTITDMFHLSSTPDLDWMESISWLHLHLELLLRLLHKAKKHAHLRRFSITFKDIFHLINNKV